MNNLLDVLGVWLDRIRTIVLVVSIIVGILITAIIATDGLVQIRTVSCTNPDEGISACSGIQVTGFVLGGVSMLKVCEALREESNEIVFDCALPAPYAIGNKADITAYFSM